MMTSPKSFHSAPHSLVQSAVAAQVRKSLPHPGLMSESKTLRGIADILEKLPHPRETAYRKPMLAVSATVQTSPFSAACMGLLLQFAWAVITGNTQLQQEIRNDFVDSGCDPGWLSAVADYVVAYWIDRDTIPYIPPQSTTDPTFIYALPEKPSLRIGILADWGTGDQVASYVLQQMMQQTPAPDLILHLGDVYYAGTSDEVQKNFVDLLNTYAPTMPVYNLPGNHDMYSGGGAFYAVMPTFNHGRSFAGGNQPAPLQGASFFCLRNSWLQLQGMDTGYYDSDLFDVSKDTTQLHPLEAAWHLDKIQNAGGRAVFLFSHHQAWSAFLPIGSGPIHTPRALAESPITMSTWENIHLQSAFAKVPSDTVRAWFWGHEHVLEVYDQAAIAKSLVNGQPLGGEFNWLPYAACVGYSAFPQFESDKPYQTYDYGPNIALQYNQSFQLGMSGPPNTEPVYDHGFTILDVNSDGSAVATYFSVPGDGSSNTSKSLGQSIIASSSSAC